MGKKSTAQPRPKVIVAPKGIGPVQVPNENDVLCGRGGRINAHEGNVQFREIVHAHKTEYLAPTTKKLEKAHIAARLVGDIRKMHPPGRFLSQEADGFWYDIGDAKAFKKVGQALREEAPQIRNEFGDGESSGEEEHEGQQTQGTVGVGAPDAASVVTPSAKSQKSSTKRHQPPPPNLVSGRGTAHLPTHRQWDVPQHRPGYISEEGTTGHPGHKSADAARKPSHVHDPSAAQRFEQPFEMRSNRGLEALDLTSSAESGVAHVVFGKHFNSTGMASSSSTNYSSISGLSADEYKTRFSSGNSNPPSYLAQTRAGQTMPPPPDLMKNSTNLKDAAVPSAFLKHSISLGSREAAARNSLRSSQIDVEMQQHGMPSNQIGTGRPSIFSSQGDVEMQRASLFSIQSDVEMQRNSLRTSHIDAGTQFGNALPSTQGEAYHPYEADRNSLRLSQFSDFEQRGSTASDLTFSLKSVATLGGSSRDWMGDSTRQGLAGPIHEEGPAVDPGIDQIMQEPWVQNGLPASLEDADLPMSLTSKPVGDPLSSGGTNSTGTSGRYMRDSDIPHAPGPMRSRNRSAGSGSGITNMSWGTGSQRSSLISSGRSVMSDLSTEMNALDLAVGPPSEQDENPGQSI